MEQSLRAPPFFWPAGASRRPMPAPLLAALLLAVAPAALATPVPDTTIGCVVQVGSCAEGHCLVVVGSCDGGRCHVEAGTCTSNGSCAVSYGWCNSDCVVNVSDASMGCNYGSHCTVNVGVCKAGGRCAVNTGTCTGGCGVNTDLCLMALP